MVLNAKNGRKTRCVIIMLLFVHTGLFYLDFRSFFMYFQDKQFKSDSTKRVDAAILAKHKKKEREAAKHGKKPFYLKKCKTSLTLVLHEFFSLGCALRLWLSA